MTAGLSPWPTTHHIVPVGSVTEHAPHERLLLQILPACPWVQKPLKLQKTAAMAMQSRPPATEGTEVRASVIGQLERR